MSSDARHLIAIFGAGRNGSTLLARLLDGSPDVWVHPVDVVFLTVWDDLARHGRVRGARLRTASIEPLRHVDTPLERRAVVPFYAAQRAEIERDLLPRLADPYPLRESALAALDRPGTTTSRDFYPELLEAFRIAASRTPDPAPSHVAFKTSETAYVDDFVRVFPELCCLHIVRHPLTNYSSFKRTWVTSKRSPFWGAGEDILRTFLQARWLPHAHAIARLRSQSPERHVVVRYEDLCADPEAEMARISAELRVRPPADPTEQTALGGERLRVLPPNPSKPGVATPTRVVADMAARFGYDDNVTAREAELIARLTERERRLFGYDDLPTARRVRLWLSWLPVDRDETENVPSWRKWLVEIVRRRLYITRQLLS